MTYSAKSSARSRRGYRQRVGLAEALVAEPDLLILDDHPPSALDPNQIRQVRDLIKNLGQKHTILLSTHILPEVEMTCSRVIILHKGRIEASDTPANLLGTLRSVGNIRLEADTGKDDGLDQLKKVPGIKEVTLEAAPPLGTAPAPANGMGVGNGFRGFLMRVGSRGGPARGNLPARGGPQMDPARTRPPPRDARRRIRRDHPRGINYRAGGQPAA